MDKREQVALQFKAVAHMAQALADVYKDKASMMSSTYPLEGGHLELVGRWSANHMEALGDILNGMDACDEADDWMAPVFEEAHRLWPPEQETR